MTGRTLRFIKKLFSCIITQIVEDVKSFAPKNTHFVKNIFTIRTKNDKTKKTDTFAEVFHLQPFSAKAKGALQKSTPQALSVTPIGKYSCHRHPRLLPQPKSNRACPQKASFCKKRSTESAQAICRQQKTARGRSPRAVRRAYYSCFIKRRKNSAARPITSVRMRSLLPWIVPRSSEVRSIAEKR